MAGSLLFGQKRVDLLLQPNKILILEVLGVLVDVLLALRLEPQIDAQLHMVLRILDHPHELLEIDNGPVDLLLADVLVLAQGLAHEQVEEDVQVVDGLFEVYFLVELLDVLLAEQTLEFFEVVVPEVLYELDIVLDDGLGLGHAFVLGLERDESLVLAQLIQDIALVELDPADPLFGIVLEHPQDQIFQLLVDFRVEGFDLACEFQVVFVVYAAAELKQG